MSIECPLCATSGHQPSLTKLYTLRGRSESAEGDVDNPLKKAKEKAAATYDAAADHFDDEPLGFGI